MAAASVGPSRAKLTGRAAILLLVVAVLAVSYASSLRAWLKQRSDINGLAAHVAEQRADIASLQQTRKRLHDPAYIESQARQRFGWIMPGETGYRVIGPDGDVLSGGAATLSDPARPDAKPPPEWWQDVYGSVVAAGEETTTPSTAPDTDGRRDPDEKTGPSSARNDQTDR
jgi:cell division protein FtsB